jgi:hypothetical protein
MTETLKSQFNGLSFNRPSGLSNTNWASVKSHLFKTEAGRLFDTQKSQEDNRQSVEKKGKTKVFNGVSFPKDDKDSSVEKKETPKNESFVE